jgi:hypothetical protein
LELKAGKCGRRMSVSVAFSPTPTISTTEGVSATETLYGNPNLAQGKMNEKRV